MSLEKQYVLDDGPFDYRPDIGPEIWNGAISIDPVTPSGPVWEEFAQRVIEEYQDPVWDSFGRLLPDSPTSSVTSYAGTNIHNTTYQCTIPAMYRKWNLPDIDGLMQRRRNSCA